MKKVSVIVIVTKDNQLEKCKQYLNKQTYKNIDNYFIDNKGNKLFSSAAKALNYAANEVNGDILVFMHQDLYLLDERAIEKTVRFLEQHPDSVVGSAGVLVEDKTLHSDMVGANNSRFDFTLDGEVKEAYSVDECYFAMTKQTYLKYKFDENYCDNWHFYAGDICYQNLLGGNKNFVLPLKINHDSRGEIYTDSFYRSLWMIIRKYRGKIEQLITPCIRINCNYKSYIKAYLIYKYSNNKIIKNIKLSILSSRVFVCSLHVLHNKMLSFIVCILLFPFVLYDSLINKRNVDDIYVVAIIKNEALYIEEWIKYHLLIGIKKIVIYDNESSDNVFEILKPYISSNKVTYKKIKGKQRQIDCYNIALKKYRNSAKYIAFIDVDEFIVNETNKNIFEAVDDIFAKNNNPGGLCLNWAVFGSNGHLTKPEGLVIENYTKRANDDFLKNEQIKTIVNPRKTSIFINPHSASYWGDAYSINVAGEKVDGSFNCNIRLHPLRINHYFTKSKEEFEIKRLRGKADALDIREQKDFCDHDKNDIIDEFMLKYVSLINEESIDG